MKLDKITVCACLSLQVFSKDDCDTTKRKDSSDTRRSKLNTYHVVNRNIAPSNITNGLKTKEGMPSQGIPKLSIFGVLEFGLVCLGHPQALALSTLYLIVHENITQNSKTLQHKT